MCHSVGTAIRRGVGIGGRFPRSGHLVAPPSARLPQARLPVVTVDAQRAQMFGGVRVVDTRGDKLLAAVRVVVGDGGHARAQGAGRVRGQEVDAPGTPLRVVSALCGRLHA